MRRWGVAYSDCDPSLAVAEQVDAVRAVVVEDGRAHLIQRRETAQDLVSRDLSILRA